MQHMSSRKDKCARTYFSVERLSNSLRRRKKERSALTVKINAVIYSGREETYVERARAGVSMRAYVYVREGQRDWCVRQSEGERERENVRARLLVCASLLPGWEVFSIERTRSVRHSLLLTDGKTLGKTQEEAHMKDTRRRCVTGPEWGNGSTWPIRKKNRGQWIWFIRSAQPERRVKLKVRCTKSFSFTEKKVEQILEFQVDCCFSGFKLEFFTLMAESFFFPSR